ncbi:MAG: YHS domain-containing (seleno)protein [Pseudomonadota bacterium]
MKGLFLGAVTGASLAVLVSVSAFAGEQYVDPTGYAVSGYDVVSYWDLEQNAVGEAQPAPLPGNTSITAEYNGSVWAFASEENRVRFLEDPEAFIPAYDGHCAYGVAQGGKVPGNPLLWRIVDDRLYLNINDRVVGWWEQDIPGYIETSESLWGGIEPRPANTTPVPGFQIDNAPVSN